MSLVRENAQIEDDDDWDYNHQSIEVNEEEVGLIPSTVLAPNGKPVHYYYNGINPIGFDLRRKQCLD